MTPTPVTTPPMRELEPPTLRRIEALLGEPVARVRMIQGGYSSALRLIIEARSGRTVFAKLGVTGTSANFLRREAWVYGAIRLHCMPEAIGWEDDPECPVLLLADLSRNTWPPPWKAESVDRSLDAIHVLHESVGALRTYAEVHGPQQRWWDVVAEDPEPLLALGVVPRRWLVASLPALCEHGRAVSAEGDRLTHFDLRSDNLSFGADRVYLTDWSHACQGNPRVDLGLFLPGLGDEGGPAPENVMPNAPDVAAWVSGFFAVHASKPHLPLAPQVRAMQRRHLAAALPWAARAIGLQPIP